MKFLMLNLPFPGHVNPTLGLAKELIQNGHEVTYILSLEWEMKIQQTGAAFIPYDNSPSGKVDWKQKIDILRYGYDTAMRIANQFDCIIYEETFYLGNEIADSFHLPAIRLFTTFALNKHVWNQFISTGGLTVKMLKFQFYRKLYTRILTRGIPVRHKDFIHEIVENSPIFNIVYTSKEFQLHTNTFAPQRYHFVGPNVKRVEKSFKIDLEKEKRTIIYISFGTILNDCLALYQLFIEAFRNSDFLIILSIGKADKTQLNNIPNNIIVENSIPQLYVLQHADLFITHSGMNSVNESLYYGVPLLSMPGAAVEYATTTNKSIFPTAIDQETISARISELNLGQVLKGKVTSEEIRQRALETLRDQDIRKNVAKMKLVMQETGGNVEAAEVIEQLVEKTNRDRKP